MKAIVTFHAIDDSGSVISFPCHKFVAFLDALDSCGTPVLSLNELLQPQVRRGVTITFDDGMSSAYHLAMKILAERGLPAHLFLVSGAVGKTNDWPGQPQSAARYQIMSWDEVLDAHSMGIRIEAHTHNHPDLRQLADEDIGREFHKCNEEIKMRTGRQPEYMAFPYGFRNARVQRLAMQTYRASLSTTLGYLAGQEARDALPRLDSYYLRPDWLPLDLSHPIFRSYVAARAMMRTVRGMVWNADHA